jgi:EAL domain-containing protein (putative c-di-GMP-specific phosphodiesterase class I)
LEPDDLELELTESMIMQDVNSAIATMSKLQSLGIKIAIDDFGTGYSSLIYLKNLPINTLKIDRYFIHNVANDPQKSAITKALIQMAHNLNLDVIAEGVETEAELAFLRQHNCNSMQGFLFSRPLPAAKFEEFLLTNKCLYV